MTPEGQRRLVEVLVTLDAEVTHVRDARDVDPIHPCRPGPVPLLDPELRRELVSLLADALVARYQARAGDMGVSPTGPAHDAGPGCTDGTAEAVPEGT